ncbi:MAG: matrixin family metalloprotease [Actinomycetia bacterium]|nr:matrixin family metalloprotease [Actinomycetes bacterium]
MPFSIDRRRFLQLSAAAGVVAADLAIPAQPDPAGAHEGEISATSFTRDPAGTTFVDIVYTPDETGYWIVDSDGKVFAVDAPHHGDLPALHAGETAVALAPTRSGNGYWLFSTLGRVFTYGDASHLGDLSDMVLADRIIDGIALDDDLGYYMLGADGGIFAFGSAEFHDSIPGVLPGVSLDEPIAGLVPHETSGYWQVAGDGGLFAFGTAPFAGSVPQVIPGVPLAAPVIGALSSGTAYLMVASDGGIFNFGNSVFHGSRPEIDPERAAPVTGVDVVSDRSGYAMIDETGLTWGFGSASSDGAGASSGVRARDTHTFIDSWIDGQPFRWPSDEPIHFVINNDLGPSGAIDAILDSVAEVSELTGIEFTYDGETDEYIGHTVVAGSPQIANRDVHQPARYGDRWAPVWIGARPYQAGLEPLAVAFSVAHLHVRATDTISLVVDGQLETYDIGEPTYVTGHVGYHWGSGSLLRFDDLAAVIRHELGHIVGLDHCNEVDQLMYPSLGFNTGFGIGDHIGLHAVGSTAIHPAAPHPSAGIPINNFVLGRAGTATGGMASGPCFSPHSATRP